MVVEEDGEIDAIITKDMLEAERAKLAELQDIKKQRDRIIKESGEKRTKGQRAEDKELREEIKKLRKRIKDAETKIKEEEKKRRERDERIESTLEKGSRALENPLGFGEGAAADLLQQIGPKAGIIGAVITAATMVFKMVQAQFGPGGIWDLRKLVKDEVASHISLKTIIDVENGNIIMSADTRLNNLPPGLTNTMDRRDGHVRFNESTLGYL